MVAFLVFRKLPGLTRDQYSAAQRAVTDVIGQASENHRIRYRGGFFLPGEACVICVFDASSATDVEAVNKQAGVPFSEVLEAIDLRLDGPRSGARTPSPRRQTC